MNPPEINGNLSIAGLRPTLHPDPFNPNQYPERSGAPIAQDEPGQTVSIARMPAVPDNPWIVKKADVQAGSVQEYNVKTTTLKNQKERRVQVYATPGQSLKDPNLLILFDDRTYTYRIPTPVILDNLYAAHKIGPTVAVFVDNGGGALRQAEMYFNDTLLKFIADEVLPWVQKEYKFKAVPSRTVVGGESLAGMTAAYLALRRPDVFGMVLSQDGSFQMPNRGLDNGEPEWLARQFVRAPKSDVFFYIDVGQMEYVPDKTPEVTNLLASNRHLRDVLNARGYRIQYSEVYGDHEPIHWRRTLPAALIVTLGN